MVVRHDEVERPDGSAGVFGVVEKPDFVIVIPVEDGHIWLVEQFRYPVGARFWELPQGSWEERPGAAALEVARAELQEETGLRAGGLRSLGHLYEAYGYSTQGMHVFLATDLEPGTTEVGVEEQDLEVRRFTIADFERLILEGEIKDAPTIAAYGLYRLGAGTA